MKRLAALVFILGPCLAAGQGLGNLGGTPPSTGLTGSFFHGDFVNYSAFFNGIWDSGSYNVGRNGGGAGGFSVGGGVALGKGFSDGGSLSLNYHGDYRDYGGSYQGGGTNQFLSLVYSRRLGRHWGISFDEGAGMLFYNNPYYQTSEQSGGGLLTNPFSSSSRYLMSSIYLSYQQSARLSYVIGGTFMLNRYNYGAAFGTTGGLITASAIYRLSSRSTVGATYSHDNFHYQGGAGDSNIDGGYVNLSHVFGRDWEATLSGGITYVRTNGVLRFPTPIFIPGIGFITSIAYNDTSNVPTIQAGLRKSFGKYNVGVSAGHGVNPGNGTYLTSSHTFLTGSVSRKFGRESVVTANGNYSKLSNIGGKSQLAQVHQQLQGYTQSYFNLGYSRVLTRHLAAQATYSYSRYGSFYGLNTVGDNRIIVGISFNSSNIPFTFF